MNAILTTVLQALIIPIISILATYLVRYIKTKADTLIAKTENELVKSYIEEAASVVTQAVTYITQTYVDSLKKQGEFDSKAQSTAFAASKDVALQLLSAEAKRTIEELYGDISIWLDTKIEQTIQEQKFQ